jgi:hypothetical protein
MAGVRNRLPLILPQDAWPVWFARLTDTRTDTGALQTVPVGTNDFVGYVVARRQREKYRHRAGRAVAVGRGMTSLNV